MLIKFQPYIEVAFGSAMKEMEESLALFKNPFEGFCHGHCYIQSTVPGNLPHHLSEDQKCPFLCKEQGLI